MFCSACGQELQPAQTACPKCGRPVTTNIPPNPQQVPLAAAGPFPAPSPAWNGISTHSAFYGSFTPAGC